jgi:hypothetical protein
MGRIALWLVQIISKLLPLYLLDRMDKKKVQKVSEYCIAVIA